jgi:hypothetical protein
MISAAALLLLVLCKYVNGLQWHVERMSAFDLCDFTKEPQNWQKKNLNLFKKFSCHP